MKPSDEAVDAAQCTLAALVGAVERRVRGQRVVVERLVVTLAASGHALVEGVPGLAKTLTVRTLADAIGARFSRVQFTPDLLPADILGTQIFHPQRGEFTVREGPIFAEIVLADEVNRAPAKVQSALLEAMEERQVTLGDGTHPLPSPFFVLATQNPIEHEGTHPLPDAQLDRFLMRLRIDYPSRDDERALLDGDDVRTTVVTPVCTPSEMLELQATVPRVHAEDAVKDYVVDLIRATREGATKGRTRWIEQGASPRATLALLRAARAQALLRGRGFVTPDDVRTLAVPVLGHRIVRTYEAEAEGLDADGIIAKLLATVPVP
jgi:MoxR-like ATPase